MQTKVEVSRVQEKNRGASRYMARAALADSCCRRFESASKEKSANVSMPREEERQLPQ